MHLSYKQTKIFRIFFFHFRKLDSILNIFKKKIALRADIFLTLGNRKNVVR